MKRLNSSFMIIGLDVLMIAGTQATTENLILDQTNALDTQNLLSKFSNFIDHSYS